MCGVNAVSCVVHIQRDTHTHTIAPLSDTCTFIIHTLAFENASCTNRDEAEERERERKNENILPKKRFSSCFRFVLF